MEKSNGFEYDADTRILIKVPKDAEGNVRQYRLTVTTADGEKIQVPVDTNDLKKLFKDWQMGVPGVVVHEPWGGLEFDESISPREAAIVSNAMNAYVKAGRLNLDEKKDYAFPGEPGYSEDKEYIEPDYEEVEDNDN